TFSQLIDLVVPVLTTPKTAHDHANDTRASRPGSDSPLGRQKRSASLRRQPANTAGVESPRRIPDGHRPRVVHPAAEVKSGPATDVFLHVRGLEPRGDPRSGRDGRPYLLGCTDNLDLEINHAPLVLLAHQSTSRLGADNNGWTSTTMRFQRPPGLASSWYRDT